MQNDIQPVEDEKEEDDEDEDEDEDEGDTEGDEESDADDQQDQEKKLLEKFWTSCSTEQEIFHSIRYFLWCYLPFVQKKYACLTKEKWKYLFLLGEDQFYWTADRGCLTGSTVKDKDSKVDIGFINAHCEDIKKFVMNTYICVKEEDGLQLSMSKIITYVFSVETSKAAYLEARKKWLKRIGRQTEEITQDDVKTQQVYQMDKEPYVEGRRVRSFLRIAHTSEIRTVDNTSMMNKFELQNIQQLSSLLHNVNYHLISVIGTAAKTGWQNVLNEQKKPNSVGVDVNDDNRFGGLWPKEDFFRDKMFDVLFEFGYKCNKEFYYHVRNKRDEWKNRRADIRLDLSVINKIFIVECKRAKSTNSIGDKSIYEHIEQLQSYRLLEHMYSETALSEIHGVLVYFCKDGVRIMFAKDSKFQYEDVHI